jgi:dTDP-glucose 4,6-dehydratase
MKILVTGGAGFIGSAVCRLAVSRGHQVINLDCLTYAANLANVSTLRAPDYVLEVANICDSEAVSRVFETHQPDAVLHLAAESHVDRSISGPGLFLETNIMGTFVLLEAARTYRDGLTADRQAAFRFHHVSTDEVYGDLEPSDPAFMENTAYNPSSPYSASKAASDHLVRAWCRTYGLPVMITNCSNNYGPYQFPEKLIPVVILNALRDAPIPIYGAGDNIRDWLYVEDHADALLTVLDRGEIGETYNIGGNTERTNLELIETICALMDRREDTTRTDHTALITFVTDRLGHDKRYAVDGSRIQCDLGWTPNTKFEDGLEKTIDWYLTRRDWWEPLIG